MGLPAEKLGKYTVKEKINKGSMGTVYLGYDPFVDRPVAIKVAHSETLNDPEMGHRYRKMFFNEAHTAGKLTHPNVISIFDAGVDDDICYIVMEYIPGGITLKNYSTPDTLLDIDKAVEVIFKCAKALDYAHQQGVIHRDIKPSNILIMDDQDIKIGDFSIAKIHKGDTTETQAMGVMGSPRYMSPEQLAEETVTQQTDIYSLGIVMYELLTGKPAYDANNFSVLVNKIMNEDAAQIKDYRPDVPAKLEEIFRKAIHKDLKQRYQTGAELASDLSQAFDVLDTPAEDIDVQERFNAIKSLEFFQGFPDVEIWEILRASTWQDYGQGNDIITEGEMDDCFYIIIKGSVAVEKNQNRIQELKQGDCFGEMGYLAKTKRTASIAAQEQTALLKINSSVISQVSLNCQVRFLKVFLRTLIYRLSDTTAKASQDA